METSGSNNNTKMMMKKMHHHHYLKSIWEIVWRNNHYFAVLFIQVVFAGMPLLSKAAITKGMNPYVFVVYRQAFAAAALAPFAFFADRSSSPPLSFSILWKIFMSSLCGITSCLLLYYLSLNYVSATFATAFTNTIPPLTFLLAVCLRVETISLKQKSGMVKLVGSAIGLSGALILTFLKGPPMNHPSTSLQESSSSSAAASRVYSKADWLKGSLILTLSNLSWSVWLLTQDPIRKEYPSKLRLTALQCLFSSIQSAIWTIAYERDMALWRLEWNLNLISVLYCGVIVTGVAYWMIVWVVGKKGAVFPPLFNPISLFLTAACSSIFFKEVLHWGSFCGAVLLLGGLYGILWGKNIEENSKISIDEETMKANEEKQDAYVINKEGVTLKCIAYK